MSRVVSDAVSDALFMALVEVETVRDRITHPNGRRAPWIDSTDEKSVEQLNKVWDAIRALMDKVAT